MHGGSVLVKTNELRPWALNLEPTLTTTTRDHLLALGWFIYKVPPVCSHFWNDFVRLCSHSLVCQALSWVLTGSSPSPIVELADMPPSLQVLGISGDSGSSLPLRDSDTDSPHTAQPVSQPEHSGVPGARRLYTRGGLRGGRRLASRRQENQDTPRPGRVRTAALLCPPGSCAIQWGPIVLSGQGWWETQMGQELTSEPQAGTQEGLTLGQLLLILENWMPDLGSYIISQIYHSLPNSEVSPENISP